MLVGKVRALYADTDQMGVVNHVVALRWFEQARAEWLRRLGHSYRQMETEGMMLPVYEVSVRYHKSARYDQVVQLFASLRQPGPVRVVFDYEIRCDQTAERLISGATHHAVVGADGKVRRLSPFVTELLKNGLDAERSAQTGDRAGCLG